LFLHGPMTSPVQWCQYYFFERCVKKYFLIQNSKIMDRFLVKPFLMQSDSWFCWVSSFSRLISYKIARQRQWRQKTMEQSLKFVGQWRGNLGEIDSSNWKLLQSTCKIFKLEVSRNIKLFIMMMIPLMFTVAVISVKQIQLKNQLFLFICLVLASLWGIYIIN
jgi:hypothetical protein